MGDKQPKLDFGPERPDNMRSWEGLFYIVWNWKDYAFKTVWFGGFPVVWVLDGFESALSMFFLMGFVYLIGKIF
tara:strand:+ start:10908 stop:11129 length:222 start_codon:yes stop_codon:yes gene_type:complete